MNSDDVILSLLSFGETGMEFISGQFKDSLDEDHITMISNFYGNVLGAADESVGLFGPLPIAYKYEILMFLYAFNAYDPNLKDERVVKRNHMTRASILIFFPTKYDSAFSSQRKVIKNIVDNWAIDYEKKDIRKVKINDIGLLKEQIVSQVLYNISKKQFELDKYQNTIKIIGKNFHLLETVLNIHNKKLKLAFYSNDQILEVVIKNSIFTENSISLSDYKKNNESSLYNFSSVSLTNYFKLLNPKNNNSSKLDRQDGVFIYYSKFENAANISNLYFQVDSLIKKTPKNCIISICLNLDQNVSAFLEEQKITSLLSKELNRSISLIDLADFNNTIEIALIDFIEKLISNVR